MRAALAPLHGGEPIPETTVSEINIAGLPGVTVPAGAYESGAPFCLIFVGSHVERGRLCSPMPTPMSRRRTTAAPPMLMNRGDKLPDPADHILPGALELIGGQTGIDRDHRPDAEGPRRGRQQPQLGHVIEPEMPLVPLHRPFGIALRDSLRRRRAP